ncbi:MAG: hypothetical protein MUC49_18130 [Raineya sp.]|jgi:hypothetical protein|nr:hypothetical protein [Raineya sp.]
MPFWYNVQQTQKRAKKIDWTPTFKKTEAKPYASMALFSLMEDLFPEKNIIPRTKVANKDSLLQGLGKKYNLFFAHKHMDGDVEYASALYFFVSGGGEAFIATTQFDYKFSDLLGEISIDFNAYTTNELTVQFTNPKLKTSSPYRYPNIQSYHYFTKYNEEECTVLATDGENRPILIKVPIGNGHFYLCSVPLIFTNFGMIDKKNHEVIAKSLSYLPIRDVLWEDLPSWRPLRRENQNQNQKDSPEGIKELAFLKKHPSLWWAFLVACASVLAFIIFRAKREQRAIPVIEKPTNTSVEFAQTIGRLYFNHQDHKNLIEKKILYLFDFIRNHLQIPIQENFDNSVLDKIVQKTAIPQDEVYSLFENIQSIKYKSQISTQELALLNTKINEFRKKCT